MTEEEFPNELLNEFKLIESYFELQLEDYFEKQGKKGKISDLYSPVIQFSDIDNVTIASFAKDTPDIIKVLLNTGLELAKARIGLRNLKQ